MTLDYSVPGEVCISMPEYVKEVLSQMPVEGEASTPAANHLFEINTKNPIKLGKAEAEHFHHMTAKLLYLSKRAHPDIQLAVSFLTTRVKSPDHDDLIS